jgi:hypothetical protein
VSIFTSQFDRVRPVAQAYAGATGDPGWRTPAAVVAVAGGGLVAVLAADAVAAEALDAGGDAAETAGAAGAAGAGATDAWGAGWDAGWDVAGAGYADPGADHSAGGEAWLDRGDHTDAGVGGDGDFFYFIDGDSSLTIG